MATLSRSNSRANPPVYRDYVNFLASYKSGKKEENFDNSAPVKNVPMARPQPTVENTKKIEQKEVKKVEIEIKPKVEKIVAQPPQQQQKSEIFIEIQPTRSVSEVSKMFQPSAVNKPEKSSSINSKISIFERQVSREKPKMSQKPVLSRFPSRPEQKSETSVSRPEQNETKAPTAPKVTKDETDSFADLPPPPPPLPTTAPPPLPPTPAFILEEKKNPAPAKLQATLVKGPQTTYSVSATTTEVPEIDRNNPMVKKLVYGALRGMYGAYHDKASDMLNNMPKNMVVRSNGLQDRIEQIAANGGLEKLNGRVNPKLEDS